MRPATTALALVSGAVLALAATPPAAAQEQAKAEMQTRTGAPAGSVTLTESPYGTLLHARLENLPSGTHAFHVHGTGVCEGDFKSAGGHYNPRQMNHGFMDADGMHAGDMPNIHVPASGTLEVEVFNPHVNLDAMLFDADGASIVIHEGADDYASDPAGAAGPRIACGVIER